MSSAWLKQIEKSIIRFKNLTIIHIDLDENIEELTQRSMCLQCNISDEELTLITNDKSIIINQKKYI